MKNLLLFAASLCLAGYQSLQAGPSPVQNANPSDVRNNCYSLLHQLLSDEKDIGKLRFIKREEADIKALVKKIASLSAAGAKRLETFAKRDPSLLLTDLRLPPGEEATRKAIASTRKKELLGQHGQDFEMSLFLSQVEALAYGAHLAEVAAGNDVNPERNRYLGELSRELNGLRGQLVSLMLSRMKLAPPTQGIGKP